MAAPTSGQDRSEKSRELWRLGKYAVHHQNLATAATFLSNSIVIDPDAVACLPELLKKYLEAFDEALLDKQSNICQSNICRADVEIVRNKLSWIERAKSAATMRRHLDNGDDRAYAKEVRAYKANEADISDDDKNWKSGAVNHLPWTTEKALVHSATVQENRRTSCACRPISCVIGSEKLPTPTTRTRRYGNSTIPTSPTISANPTKSSNPTNPTKPTKQNCSIRLRAEATRLYEMSVGWDPHIAFSRVCFGRFLARHPEKWSEAVIHLTVFVHLSFYKASWPMLLSRSRVFDMRHSSKWG
jgi:hypothetical protein